MAGPMDGIRVAELAFWVAGPAASGILADWGAQVIKIEPATGDPYRGLISAKAAETVGPQNPAFDLDNRGKRSISVDVTTDAGREIASRIVDEADVFVTNLRPRALAKLGLDPKSLLDRRSDLIFGLVTGYGLDGPESNRPSYDAGAFWARGGFAHALTPSGIEPLVQRPAIGDHIAALTLAGGVAAALHARTQTGRGQLVTTSLFRVAAYVLSFDLMLNLRGFETSPLDRQQINPLMNCFRTSDGEWFWLLCLQTDRHWPDVARAIDRLDLVDDERFSTVTNRATHAAELFKILEDVFCQRSMSTWSEILDREDVWWAPVQATHDLLDDPQAGPAGVFVDVPVSDGSTRMVATPWDFSYSECSPTAASPEIGQHTEQVLLELGYGWEDIAHLASTGVTP